MTATLPLGQHWISFALSPSRLLLHDKLVKMSSSGEKIVGHSDVDVEANVLADKAEGINASNADDTPTDRYATGNNNDGVTIVDFNGPDDPRNPMNWSSRKKTFTIVLVTLMTILS